MQYISVSYKYTTKVLLCYVMLPDLPAMLNQLILTFLVDFMQARQSAALCKDWVQQLK